MLIVIFLLLGIVLLYLGAELLMRGSVTLAYKVGITRLVVGLTVIAYGTSSPELVVSVLAAINGNGAIAIGNVIGSNIFNIALILGISALISPLSVSRDINRFQMPIMIAMSSLCLFAFLDGVFSRAEGGVFFFMIIAYTIWSIMRGRAEFKSTAISTSGEKTVGRTKIILINVFYVVGGLAILVLGARTFIEGAIRLAREIGVSDAIIGLTIVAAGTSLPELATSTVASLKKESDIAIGNIVGSNIFNILLILGVASLIAPLKDPGIHLSDFFVMIAVSLFLFVLTLTKATISRLEGFFLLVSYSLYIGYLIY